MTSVFHEAYHTHSRGMKLVFLSIDTQGTPSLEMKENTRALGCSVMGRNNVPIPARCSQYQTAKLKSQTD